MKAENNSKAGLSVGMGLKLGGSVVTVAGLALFLLSVSGNEFLIGSIAAVWVFIIGLAVALIGSIVEWLAKS